jgi:hypothetical protein
VKNPLGISSTSSVTYLHKALGTIASGEGDHVKIKTNDGKSIAVMLDKKTT